MVKPFTARELVARVGASIEVARLHRDAARTRAEVESAHASLDRLTRLQAVTASLAVASSPDEIARVIANAGAHAPRRTGRARSPSRQEAATSRWLRAVATPGRGSRTTGISANAPAALAEAFRTGRSIFVGDAAGGRRSLHRPWPSRHGGVRGAHRRAAQGGHATARSRRILLRGSPRLHAAGREVRRPARPAMRPGARPGGAHAGPRRGARARPRRAACGSGSDAGRRGCRETTDRARHPRRRTAEDRGREGEAQPRRVRARLDRPRAGRAGADDDRRVRPRARVRPARPAAASRTACSRASSPTRVSRAHSRLRRVRPRSRHRSTRPGSDGYPPRSRAPCTSAASKRCRTLQSTPAPTQACIPDWRSTKVEVSRSRYETMASASTLPRRRPEPDSRTCEIASQRAVGR